ncbi:MAG: DUF4097 family beta strand repeat protein [Candidatus Didemnitutus sp.]|nr:DUF4097 family beta strand repeat protein [Candidatus Didemnitutus sp.]
MKILPSMLAAGLLTLAPLALSAKIVRTVERSFTVQPGGNLTVVTQGGDIVVHTADTPEVRVVARQTVRANTDTEADKLLADQRLRIEQEGNDVVAEAKYERSKSGLVWKSWPPVTVDFTVTVPRSYNLGLTTSGGDIGVESLQGQVKARTSGGDLNFARIDGELEARTSGGDIEVESARGPTEVSTSGGNIRIEAATELVSATTSGGNVRVSLAGPLQRDAFVSTSGGNVVVRVPAAAGFQLDARTSGGNVKAAGLTLQIGDGGIGKSRLAGAVNGGGPVLKLRTSGGDITLKTE